MAKYYTHMEHGAPHVRAVFDLVSGQVLLTWSMVLPMYFDLVSGQVILTWSMVLYVRAVFDLFYSHVSGQWPSFTHMEHGCTPHVRAVFDLVSGQVLLTWSMELPM